MGEGIFLSINKRSCYENQNLYFIVCRHLRAFQNYQGGGGVNCCKSALLRAFLTLSAALFSAGFNISANAQYVSEATADVYQRSQFVITFGGIDIIYGDPLPDIIASITIASDVSGIGTTYGIASRALRRANPGDGNGVSPNENMVSDNGLLLYSSIEMAPGDRFFVTNSGFVPQATIFLYTATGGELTFADDTENPKAAADLQSGEFYIDNNGAETTQPAAGFQGFTPAVCDTDSGYELQSDMTSCECLSTLPVEQNGICVAAPPTLNCDAASTTGQNGDECTCRDGFTERVSPEMCRMPQNPPDENPQTGNNTQTSGGDSESKAAKVIGVVGIGMAIFVIANGGLFSDAFAFSPDFGYSLTESGYAANAGGRMDFRKDNWHLYQSADSDFHRNGSFEFRYTSGGKYTADFWTATFSESVAGETADYNFALSADFRGGIWKISPNYRMHSEYEKGEFTTRNSLNLQSNFRYNGWTINPSAGFQWRRMDDFADGGTFRIDAVHRF